MDLNRIRLFICVFGSTSCYCSCLPARMQEKWVFFLLRISNMMFGIWFLIGMIWTFNSRNCVCLDHTYVLIVKKQTSPTLYVLCLAVISLTLTLLCLLVVCCLCGTLFVGIIYFLNPGTFGQYDCNPITFS